MSQEYPNSRKAALAAGVSKFDTGKPCRNGHMAFRYTQSGTCSACIRSTDDARPQQQRDDSAPLKAKQSERLAALAQLVAVSIRSTPETVTSIRNLASGLVTMRFPELERADAWSPKAGTDYQAGTCQYKFNLHPEDIPFIRQQAQLVLNGGRKVDVAAERRRIFEAAIAPWKGEDDEPPFVP